jgi:hypothetical protein
MIYWPEGCWGGLVQFQRQIALNSIGLGLSYDRRMKMALFCRLCSKAEHSSCMVEVLKVVADWITSIGFVYGTNLLWEP